MDVKDLLKHLSRKEVQELALATGRAPMARINNTYQALAAEKLTDAAVRDALKILKGEPHLAKVSDKPTSWSWQHATLGKIAVQVVLKGTDLQARVVVQRGAPAPTGKPAPAPLDDVKTAAPAPVEKARPAPAPMPLDVPAPPVVAKAAEPPASEPEAEVLEEVAPTPPAPKVTPVGAPPTRTKPSIPPGFTLDMYLQGARSLLASDLHLVADRPVLLRIAGELIPYGEPIPAAAVDALLVHAVPDRLQEQLERDGSVDFALSHATLGRFRVNVSRQRTGLKGSFRVIPTEIPTLAMLGLPEQIAGATHHHQGLIIITGPSGHGKTTTLAAILDIINAGTSHHIITVEDPIEFLHPRKRAMMSQREVGAHTRTFASALKGSLREDPDVIMVGELRDTETVRMALSASETGHLVLGTMNTPSAAKTIDRLIDLFPPADQAQVRTTLAGALRMVVSQRLMPSSTGKFSVVAAEVLPGMVPLWNLIRENKTYQIPSLQQRGKALGIITLNESLAELVRSGRTTLEVAKQNSEAPDELEAIITGKRPGAEAAPPPKEQNALFQKAGALLGRKGA
ncbi:MAG: PilT/PilU family type 4a pilus ATPase [Myxococcota bacterium]